MHEAESNMNMTNQHPLPDASRRTFLRRTGVGIGTLALGSLLDSSLLRSAESEVKIPNWEGVARPLVLPARCKRVIHLCMAGGMSHHTGVDRLRPEDS